MFGVVYTQSRTLKKLGSQQCAGFYIYHQLPAHYITSSVSNGKVLPEISVELYSTCFIWQRVLRPARGHLAHVPQRRCGVPPILVHPPGRAHACRAIAGAALTDLRTMST